MSGHRNWTHAAGTLWPMLVEAGQRGGTLTYSQAATAIATNPLSVAYALGPIQEYCLENRLAPLTVVVVGKHSGVPGGGFIAWEVDDLEAGRTAVRLQNWELVGNPFAGFGVDEDEVTLAERLIADPGRAGDIARKVRDRGMLQRIFRIALMDAYDGCALCGLTFPAALEAAHILPWNRCSDQERMDVRNGLLLCSSHHRLLDADVFVLEEDFSILYYDPDAEDGPYSRTDRDFALAFHGKAVRLPAVEALRPNPSFIRRRRTET